MRANVNVNSSTLHKRIVRLVAVTRKWKRLLCLKIMLQFQNGDTSWHQGDNEAISMLRMAFFEKFDKKFYVHVLAQCDVQCSVLNSSERSKGR